MIKSHPLRLKNYLKEKLKVECNVREFQGHHCPEPWGSVFIQRANLVVACPNNRRKYRIDAGGMFKTHTLIWWAIWFIILHSLTFEDPSSTDAFD